MATSKQLPMSPSAAADPRAGIQSVEVGFALLKALSSSRQAMMLRDLASSANMSPAKAHRYLVSFQRLGLVVQDVTTNRYDLGPSALRMGLASLSRLDAVRLGRAAMPALGDAIGHTMALAVWGNQGPTMVHWQEATKTVSVQLRLGDVMPLLSSATGRCFLSFMGHEQPDASSDQRLMNDMLQRELTLEKKHPRSGVAHTAALVKAMRTETLQQGLARVVDSLIPGVAGFCAPVFDAQGHLVMGIVTLGGAGGFDSRWHGGVATTLRQAAAALSQDLGWQTG
jgi:DNA-binding IclR family transcriptional regulator